MCLPNSLSFPLTIPLSLTPTLSLTLLNSLSLYLSIYLSLSVANKWLAQQVTQSKFQIIITVIQFDVGGVQFSVERNFAVSIRRKFRWSTRDADNFAQAAASVNPELKFPISQAMVHCDGKWELHEE